MPEERKDRHFLDALAEGTEAIVDFMTENEAVKAVPVVSQAFKILKGYDDLKSRMLRKKLLRFLSEPSLRAASEARSLRDSIVESHEREQEIGEMLFLVMDNATDMTKPVLLAKAYATYLDGQLDPFALEAIAHAIDKAFIRDIQKLLDPSPGIDQTMWRHRLVGVGLMEVLDESWDHSIVEYQLTPLGSSLQHAIEHATRLSRA